jgi:ribosomal protein S18 acetylase RimI-like enzyme
MGMRIDLLEERHLDDMAEVYLTVFNGPPWNDSWTTETARQRIDEIRRTPGFLGYATYWDEKPAGLLVGVAQTWHDGPAYQVREICIVETFRGKGLARQMIQKLEARLIELGAHQIYVMTRKSGPAQDFYGKFGLRPNASTIVMNKILPHLKRLD